MFQLGWRFVDDVIEKFKDCHRPWFDDGLVGRRLTVAAKNCIECPMVGRGNWIPEKGKSVTDFRNLENVQLTFQSPSPPAKVPTTKCPIELSSACLEDAPVTCSFVCRRTSSPLSQSTARSPQNHKSLSRRCCSREYWTVSHLDE